MELDDLLILDYRFLYLGRKHKTTQIVLLNFSACLLDEAHVIYFSLRGNDEREDNNNEPNYKVI